MAVFTRVKTWVSNEVLTASDLNGEFNNLLTNTIPASIEDYSTNVAAMQLTSDPGGVGTESLATTLAGEIERLRYKIKQIIGGAQWYSTTTRNLGTSSLAILAGDISSDAVTTAKILDSNVTTAKIADGAVTQAKRVALGQQVSASSGAFSSISTTPVDVTNLSVTITTTGRPVFIGLIQDGTMSHGSVALGASASTQALGEIKIVRGATDVSLTDMRITVTGATAVDYRVTPSSVSHIDVVAGGTYTYKIQVKVFGADDTIYVNYAKLIAFEL